MTSMIERVARAICIATGLEPDRKNRSSDEGDGTAPHDLAWHAFQPEARAAILAMREPSDAMLSDRVIREHGYAGDIDLVWHALIDLALADAPSA
ncbi:hypothetical protein [Bosea sp. NPDC055594]